ncbi:MAG: hypothetical protein ACI30H_01095 [Paludibacteraceae bacterium]
MKIRILLLFAACLPMLAFAQVEIESIEEVAAAAQPVFSANGAVLLLSGVDGRKGLFAYDMATRQTTFIADTEAAEPDAVLSDGGTTVAFRQVAYQNHMPYTSIKAKNMKTGTLYEIDAPSARRHAFAFAGGKVKVAKRTTISSVRILNDVRQVEHEYVLTIEDQDLVLYDGNKRRVLNPQGKGSYIWERISPDQKHIVYMAIHKNCHTFVANIDGSNPIDLGYIGAPVWYDNDMIVGMLDLDDGQTIVKSELVAIRIDGTQRQILATPQQPHAMYPAANAKAAAIAFENDGKIYLMKLKKR